MEVWKSLKGIVEHGANYKVSNTGKVWSDTYAGRLLGQDLTKAGYLRAALSYEGTTKKYAVHRLVALAFIPNCENKEQVNHRDGDKINNHVDNLEWVTAKENKQHAFNTGLNQLDCAHLRKPVFKISNTGTLIEEYLSTRDASRKTGIPQVTISQQCRFLYKSRKYPFYFRYNEAM